MNKLWIVGLSMLLGAGSAHAAAFTNGDFENGLTNVGSFTTLSSGDTSSITGWTVGGNGVDYIGDYWTNESGARSVDLSALSAGSLSQTFDTVAGKIYSVSFWLAGNPAGDPAVKTLEVSVSGVVQSDYTFDKTGKSLAVMGWKEYSFSFVGAGSNTLTFASEDFTPYGPALDNVSVSAVPLPASLPLFGGALLSLVGFGYAVNRWVAPKGKLTA